MKLFHIMYLCCPRCYGDLAVHRIEECDSENLKTGKLRCCGCLYEYRVVASVPRFVPRNNYAGSFGYQWCRHARTQFDSYTRVPVSKERWFAETRWNKDLRGECVLEVGSGAGRFTEHAAATNAMVISLDFSSAVDENWKLNGQKPNVLVIQGDILAMPVRKGWFDKVFCLGVLQHTPNSEASFLSLPAYLKPGGNLVIDVYRWSWWTYLWHKQYWIRWITTRLDHEKLYRLCEKYVELIWPLASKLSRLPKGHYVGRFFLIGYYKNKLPLPDKVLKEWCVLSTFDALSPAYDKPQSLSTVRKWFQKAGLEHIEVEYGYNGIEGRATKPS